MFVLNTSATQVLHVTCRPRARTSCLPSSTPRNGRPCSALCSAPGIHHTCQRSKMERKLKQFIKKSNTYGPILTSECSRSVLAHRFNDGGYRFYWFIFKERAGIPASPGQCGMWLGHGGSIPLSTTPHYSHLSKGHKASHILRPLLPWLSSSGLGNSSTSLFHGKMRTYCYREYINHNNKRDASFQLCSNSGTELFIISVCLKRMRCAAFTDLKFLGRLKSSYEGSAWSTSTPTRHHYC